MLELIYSSIYGSLLFILVISSLLNPLNSFREEIYIVYPNEVSSIALGSLVLIFLKAFLKKLI